MAAGKKTGTKWIQSAIKRPGALTRKAKRAGMSTTVFARAHAKDKGTTGRQARLALTLAKLRRGKKRTRREK